MIFRPSPNYDKRPDGTQIKSVIIHATGMPTAEEALDRLCDPESKVSVHFTIDTDGTLYKHVDPEYRAWHAGVSKWGGMESFNDFSIGIELVNAGRFCNFENGTKECGAGYHPFPDEQIECLISLLKQLYQSYPIDKRLVLGHSDIAPARRKDPGYLFPWKRLMQEDLAIRV